MGEAGKNQYVVVDDSRVKVWDARKEAGSLAHIIAIIARRKYYQSDLISE